MEKLGGLFDCLCIYYLHDKDSTILYNNYIHNFWGGKLENKVCTNMVRFRVCVLNGGLA